MMKSVNFIGLILFDGLSLSISALPWCNSWQWNGWLKQATMVKTHNWTDIHVLLAVYKMAKACALRPLFKQLQKMQIRMQPVSLKKISFLLLSSFTK